MAEKITKTKQNKMARKMAEKLEKHRVKNLRKLNQRKNE